MPRHKTYKATEVPTQTTQELIARFERPDSMQSLELNYAEESGGRRNPGALRNLTLTSWSGTALEAWARAWVTTVRYLIWRGDTAIATCGDLGTSHRAYFSFLGEPGLRDAPKRPQDLRPQHLALYRQWLNAKFSRTRAYRNYNSAKTVMMAMLELGLISGYPDDLFPRNAMPRGPATQAASAFSSSELQALVAALKQDLIALHKGTFEQSKRHNKQQAIMVYFLVLALRTGGNSSSLLELTRGGLKPHLVPGMMRIDLAKERAPNTYIASLRISKTIEGVLSVPIDGVAILNRVLETTAPLVAGANKDCKDRVWLYETKHPGSPVVALTPTNLNKATTAFVLRHGLRGDDGARLVLTVSRLRKSKAQQLYKLSGGDLATVAMLLGNTPAVAAQHYMNISSELRAEGAVFVGEVLEAVLAGVETTAEPKPVQLTPVGRCKDSLNGERAPQDGKTHCDQFLHCLGCSSFAIAGTAADLHRLFSFQAYLRAEMAYYPPEPDYEAWRAHRAQQVAAIDGFTAQHFRSALIEEARSLASSSPHRFWAIQEQTLTRVRSSHA